MGVEGGGGGRGQMILLTLEFQEEILIVLTILHSVWARYIANTIII